MDQALGQHLVNAAKVLEDQVDAEIERLDKLTSDDLDSLREKRLAEMKKMHEQKQEWLSQGHGQYEEIAEEKEFFNVCKKNKFVVCHFYRDSTFRCKIVDKHLAILAPSHLETKFMKINAEKCPFLVERLRIKVMPTVCLAKDGKTIDYIVGFDDLGNTDEFPTEMLEWRIARAGVINYSGDLLHPPEFEQGKKKSILGLGTSKTIRGGGADDSGDENDW